MGWICPGGCRLYPVAKPEQGERGLRRMRLSCRPHPAAVGLGLGDGRLLAGLQLLHCFAHVILGGARVAVGGRPVVNGALVSQDALLVDDEHVRGGLHAVGLADLAGAVVEPGGGGDLLGGPIPSWRPRRCDGWGAWR